MNFLKVYIPYLFILLGLAVVVHFVWLPYYTSMEIEGVMTHEKEKIRLMADIVIPALLSGDLAEMHETLDTVVQHNKSWNSIVLENNDGVVLYPFDEETKAPVTDLTNLAQPLQFEDKTLGKISVLTDSNQLVKPKLELITKLEILVFASTVLIILFGILIQNRFFQKPLEKLALISTQIAQGKYDVSMPKSSDHALNQFVESFDKMRDNLEKRNLELNQQHDIQHAVTSMQNQFLRVDGAFEVFEGMLQTLLKLTGSEFGYIGEVYYTKDRLPYLRILAMSNFAWDISSRQLFESSINGALYFKELDNLVSQPLVTGRLFIQNEPAVEPFKGLMPEGHPAVNRFVGIPQFNGMQQFTGVVGLFNSHKDYSTEQINKLSLVWGAIGNLIDAFRKKAQLSENEAQLRAIVNNALEGIIILDSDGRIMSFNPAAELIFGYRIGEVLNHHFKMLLASSHEQEDKIHLDYIDNEWSQVTGKTREIVGRRKNGYEFSMELSLAEVRTETIHHLTCIIRDISERKEKEKQLLQAQKQLKKTNKKLINLSLRDGMTGLANRRNFDETLQAELNRGTRNESPLSLLLFDIDHFKKYNDFYGHVEGDNCLKAIGELLNQVFKREGDLVARYGGEEFAVILPSTQQHLAIKFAETILEQLERLNIPHEKSTTAGHVTVSLGVASLVPNAKITPRWLIEQADQALYQAKMAGRNRIEAANLEESAV